MKHRVRHTANRVTVNGLKIAKTINGDNVLL